MAKKRPPSEPPPATITSLEEARKAIQEEFEAEEAAEQAELEEAEAIEERAAYLRSVLRPALPHRVFIVEDGVGALWHGYLNRVPLQGEIIGIATIPNSLEVIQVHTMIPDDCPEPPEPSNETIALMVRRIPIATDGD